MNIKLCKYSKCKKLIFLYPSSEAGCCSREHVKLAKQEYNKVYYKKNKLNTQIVEHGNIFKSCIDQFGEGKEFDASFLQLLKFDWNLETHRIVIANQEFIAIGVYAYILTKNKKVKIIRL